MCRHLVEMPCTIVPIDANFLRAAADACDTEEEPAVRAVEIARRKRQLGQLLSYRTFMQRLIVSSNGAAVAVEKSADRIRGQLTVLEGARDSLAHQRIDPGGIAGKHDASASITVARVEPSNRERMPSRGTPGQAVERKFGKRRDEFRDHKFLFSTLLFQFARPLIVDADVEMRRASKQAGERPTVAVDSAADASEVKA